MRQVGSGSVAAVHPCRSSGTYGSPLDSIAMTGCPIELA